MKWKYNIFTTSTFLSILLINQKYRPWSFICTFIFWRWWTLTFLFTIIPKNVILHSIFHIRWIAFWDVGKMLENWTHLNVKNIRQWLIWKLGVNSQLKVEERGDVPRLAHSECVYIRIFPVCPVYSLQTGEYNTPLNFLGRKNVSYIQSSMVSIYKPFFSVSRSIW